MHEAVPAIASCGVSPIVRVPDMQGWMIKRKHCGLAQAGYPGPPRGGASY